MIFSSSRRLPRTWYRVLGALSCVLLFSLPESLAQDQSAPPPEATEVWEPAARIVAAPADRPPSDAIILFDGTSLAAWAPTRPSGALWTIETGALVPAEGVGNIRTRQGFGDMQVHLEFRTPSPASGTGQARGNSGVLFMGRYELQILDSYENATYSNGQAASVYKQHIPLVNASRPPGEWQSFDVVFIAPRFTPDGELRTPAYMTVFHNGVLVQHAVKLLGTTVHRGYPSYKAHGEREPLVLQFHKNAVAFRNIWVRELALPNR